MKSRLSRRAASSVWILRIEGRGNSLDQVGDTIHLLHEVSESARYYAFHTSDHPTRPDTWAVGGELVPEVEPVARSAALVVRSDGSLLAFGDA